jgi:hypothetical protein
MTRHALLALLTATALLAASCDDGGGRSRSRRSRRDDDDGHEQDRARRDDARTQADPPQPPRTDAEAPAPPDGGEATDGDRAATEEALRRIFAEHERGELFAIDARKLVGRWQTQTPVAQVTLTLEANGQFGLVMTNPMWMSPEHLVGTYKVVPGNRLILRYAGNVLPEETSTVRMPDANTLVLETEGHPTLEYQRVQ